MRERTFTNGTVFALVSYDLLYEPVDCIVNAANGGLSHGGGVAAAISISAGPELEKHCHAIVSRHGHIPVGGAVISTAGNLPFKGVIHAVGPRNGEGNEEAKIVSALKASFVLADNKGWESISFPGISSGIFSVPIPICAKAYIMAVEQFCNQHPKTGLKLIRVCLRPGTLLKETMKYFPDSTDTSNTAGSDDNDNEVNVYYIDDDDL